MKQAHIQSIKGRKAAKRHQRGNGLLYALLGSALLAAGSYYAFGIYQDKQMSASIQADITNVQDTVQMTQRLFGASNDYAAQTTATLVQSGAIPPRMRVAGTNTAQNSFSQNVTAASANGTGVADLMVFSWPTSKAACTEFVQAIGSFSRRIDVGAATVKPLDGVLAGATTAAQCDATAIPIVKFYVGRFAAVAQ